MYRTSKVIIMLINKFLLLEFGIASIPLNLFAAKIIKQQSTLIMFEVKIVTVLFTYGNKNELIIAIDCTLFCASLRLFLLLLKSSNYNNAVNSRNAPC